MHALITGARGTVGRALTGLLTSRGHRVTRWDRSAVPTDDYGEMERFVRATRPDALFHLAVASVPTGYAREGWAVTWQWSSELAWLTRQLDIPFVFTSTVLVFAYDNQGPFTIGRRPDADDGGYGTEKREAEVRVRAQNPDARIVRLGWQIGTERVGNQMVAWLHDKQASEGRVEASTTWLPAAAFLEDTADALVRAATMRPGLYHADANRGWSFYDLATALRDHHGASWDVVATCDPCWDQRLVDPRLPLTPLDARLPGLPPLGG